MTSPRHPFLPVLFCALLWGTAFPGIKAVYGYWEEVGIVRTLPMIFLFAGVRFSLAGVGLLVAGRKLSAEFRATPLKWVVLLALLQTFVQYIFFYQAVAVSSASLTALLVATGSFWWMLLAPLIQKTPWPRAWQWAGLALGGVGVTLAVYAPGAGTGRPVMGALMMLTATCSGALGVIVFQRMKETMSSVNATGLSLLMGGCAFCLAGSSALPEASRMFDGPVIWLTLWLAVVSAAAFSLWNYLSTLYPVTLLASYRFLIPVCGVVEAIVLLKDEQPGWGLFVGGALVVGSVLIAQRSGSRKAV